MQLRHKGILFIVLVCALQLVLFGALVFTLQRVESERERARQIALVQGTLRSVDNNLHTGTALLLEMALARNKTASASRFDEICQDIPRDLSVLHENAAQLPAAQQHLITEVAERCSFLIETMKECRQELKAGSLALKLVRAKKTLDYQILPQLIDIESSIKDIELQYPLSALDDSEQHNKQVIEGVLCVMFVGILFTAVMLTVSFSKSVTRRLTEIADNIVRFAAGKSLRPAMTGQDELSTLDRTFHSMAKAIAEAMAKDKAVFDTMPIALFTVGEKGNVESLNPRAQEMLQTTEANLIGRAFVDLLRRGPATFEKILVDESQKPARYIFPAGQNTERPVELSIAKFQHNGLARYVICAVDLTEREYAEKLRAEMISIVSHDLRSPLTSIGLFLESMKEGIFGDIGDELQKRSGELHRECSRLMRLTKDLLDVNVLESGNIKLLKREVRLANVFEQAFDSVASIAEHKNIELDATNGDICVLADSERLTQILINYLTNAIKFSQPGTTVSMRAELNADCVVICVCDTGRGVPLSLQSVIFERFKQVSETDRKIGTGLGLAICKLLAEAHGGSVGVISEENKGSTFWVRLPQQSGNAIDKARLPLAGKVDVL